VIQDPAGPAAAFLTATLQRQQQTVLALLDENVTTQIPSLGFTCDGRAETAAALGMILTAFSEVRYDIRHRYISPGSLTDEVVLSARQHGPFFGHPPDGQPVHLSARIQVDHNGTTVTSVTLWADQQALHDLATTPTPGDTGVLTVVSALRATMPRQDARVTVSTDRPLPPFPQEAIGTEPAPGIRSTDQRTGPGSGPRPQEEGNQHRLLTWGIGAVVMVAAVTLTTWTARTATTDLLQTARAAPSTTAPSAVPTPAASLPGGVVFSQDTHSYDLSSDVLFSPDSADLTVRAQEILDVVVDQVRLARPTGIITVTGYTDTTGSPSYNLALSDRRARAVAEILAQGLVDLPELSIVSHGAGETGTEQDNDTPTERAANRRVTVALPAPEETATTTSVPTVENGSRLRVS
jgi:outer membrane protein OmpA-like peptidoglycan-associated protein